MKNLSKAILAVLAAGLFSCGLLTQQAQAVPITGDVNFGGVATFDTTSLATAASVQVWNSSFVISSSGDFGGIAMFTPVAMAATWIFNPSTPTPGLWSVGGFTFDLLSSVVSSQSKFFLNITGFGILSGNGFDPTPGEWSFTSSSANGKSSATFGFQSNTTAAPVPDGGATVLLLGLALAGVEVLRTKLKAV